MDRGTINPVTGQIQKVEETEFDLKRTSEALRYNLEFNRYKQDCRKRALDLAHNEINDGMAKKLADGNETKDVSALADKYYNWLISIPNE